MQWIPLSSVEELEKVVELSHSKPVAIFKHSTRCSVSSMALRLINAQWDDQFDHIAPYFLDLIQFRAVSNLIADQFQIEHESPQILLVKSGRVTYFASHQSINIDELLENV